MKPHLKEHQYYSDLYDRHTVENCRGIESRYNESIKNRVGKKMTEKDSANLTAHRLIMYFETGERYIKKQKTIDEWIARDTARDDLYNSAQASEEIRCLTCSTLMTVTLKDLQISILEDSKDRILFMYDCPNKCLPRRAFFDNGEEWKPKVHLCPKCNTELESSNERKGDKVITTETCNQCDYSNVDELDLSAKKEKPKIDKDFEKDRARFCLSEEEGQKYIQAKTNMEQMKHLVDEMKEREKNKDTYDKVAKLKKLTLVQLENTLTPELEKNGYIKLELATPEMDKDVIVGFTVRESKDDREEYDSKNQLKKLVQNLLKDTNWRLMSDGIHYRLGILQGRLRAYEREGDLKKLVLSQLRQKSKEVV
ncbi:MAG: hypothetical protein ACPGO5_02775 [Patescibacteria group bacterium]